VLHIYTLNKTATVRPVPKQQQQQLLLQEEEQQVSKAHKLTRKQKAKASGEETNTKERIKGGPHTPYI
jgi:hypothetical protein